MAREILFERCRYRQNSTVYLPGSQGGLTFRIDTPQCLSHAEDGPERIHPHCHTQMNKGSIIRSKTVQFRVLEHPELGY
jgi:hypothetical protein